MSRPEITIDWERVDAFLEAGALGNEIAAFFGIHPNTFYDRVYSKYNSTFSDYAAQKRSTGEALLREAQQKKALSKLDNTMLIWLGKQRLGQKDHHYEKPISEEILMAFNQLMQQLAQVQSERSSVPIEPKKEVEEISLESPNSISSISQSVRDSQFR